MQKLLHRGEETYLKEFSKVDIVLGSDIVYDEDAIYDLLITLR